MLVSEELANKMYSKSGFLYKNFTILFQNALWHKSMPSGFAICPFFWLSLIGAIFRVLIHWPVEYLIKPICKGVFTCVKLAVSGLNKGTAGLMHLIDNQIRRVYQKIFPSQDFDDGICSAITAIIFGCSVGLWFLVKFLAGIVMGIFATGIAGYIIPLATIPILVGMFVFMGLLKFKYHKCEKNHFVYPLALLLALIGVSVVFTPYAIPAIGAAIGGFIVSLVGAICACIMGILSGAWWCIESIGMGFGLMWPSIVELAPTAGLIVGIVASFGLVGLGLDKFMQSRPAGEVETVDPNAPKPWWRSQWESLFAYQMAMNISDSEILNRFRTVHKKDKATILYIKSVVAKRFVRTCPPLVRRIDSLGVIRPVINVRYIETRPDERRMFKLGKVNGQLVAKLDVGDASKAYDLIDEAEDLIIFKKDDGIYAILETFSEEYEKDEKVAAMLERFAGRVEKLNTMFVAVEVICSKACAVGRPIRKKASLVGEWCKLGWDTAWKKKKDVCPWKTFHD